jgi:hypothetical protein
VRIFLIVKVTDVNNSPQTGCNVLVQFGGLGPGMGNQTARAAGPNGTFEVPIPDAADVFTISVDKAGFFTALQTVKIVRSATTPALIFTGAGQFQELNTLRVGGHSRDGVDFNLEIFFGLGHLRNARSSVEAVMRFRGNPRPIVAIDPVTRPVLDFNGASVLDPAGKGWFQFRHVAMPRVTPVGKMLYAERVETPKLIGIWVPDGVAVTRQRSNVDPSKSPINFHVFYHPSPGVLSGPYPFSFAYVDLISRYLFYFPKKHKEMVNQQAAAGAKTVFVFPVGSPSGWYDKYGGQSSVLRLLQEVAFFLQRMHGIPIPLQPVGKCAISGFSAGGAFVNQALTLENAFFDGNVLREIYAFDIRGATPTGFAQTLRSWLQRNRGRDADPRKFRLYTTVDAWFAAHEGIDPTAVPITGPAGSRERSGPNFTAMFTPESAFWTALNPAVTGDGLPEGPSSYQVFNPVFDDVHQLFPALFLEHALRNSQFK